MNILIVEDSLDLAEIYEFHLRKNGRIIKSTSTPPEALNFLEQNYFDIVISDYILPNMNGLDFCNLVSNRYKTKCVIISAVAGIELENIKKSGFDYFEKAMFSFDDFQEYFDNLELELKSLFV